MVPRIFAPQPCPHCFAPDGMVYRLDKRQKLYSTCEICSTKTFYATARALRGAAVLPALTAKMLEWRDTRPEYKAEQDRTIETFRRELIAVLTPSTERSDGDEQTATRPSFRDRLVAEEKAEKAS